MRPEDQAAVHAMIQKLKDAASDDRERVSADLETLVMMVAEPEIQWEAPLILRQNNRSYRAYPLD